MSDEADDTSPEARRVLIECYRRMPAARKWARLASAYSFAKTLHATGVRLRNPAATDEDVRCHWVAITIGVGPWTPHLRYDLPTTRDEQQDAVKEVVTAFRAEGIATALGGSMASSIHGTPRYTEDAALTAEPFPGKEAAFVGHFDPDVWYADVGMVKDAVRRRASFNLIHLLSGFKVDVFVRKDRPFETAMWDRRQPGPDADATGRPINVVSAEDVVLLKLEWYRKGGGGSGRQWDDILGVLRVKAGLLDDAYLDKWAADLGVSDLLARVRSDV